MNKTIITLATVSLVLSGTAFAQVKIGGKNDQQVDVKNGAIINSAAGAASQARQNIASNKGNVNIGGDNHQQVNVKNGAIINSAAGAATKAVQNVASNDGTSH
jgi:uncharacterized protein YjlB